MHGFRPFIDTSLLVLLTVGSLDRRLIAKHKRSKNFTVEDYEQLLSWISARGGVCVTPNVLTETSNLLGQHEEPQRGQLLVQLRQIIENGKEIVVASIDAARNPSFKRLGLTDAALLELVSRESPLMTTDFELYMAANQKQDGAAYNFKHLDPDSFDWGRSSR